MLARTRSLVAALALLTLIGWGMVAAASHLRSLMLHWRMGTDEFGASEWEPRVADLRAAIPAGVVVGYLSEKDLPESQFNPGDQLEEMLLTQYYLAPRILVPGSDAPLVIGNFGREKVDPDVLVQQYGLRIRMDLGGGIYLLERSEQ